MRQFKWIMHSLLEASIAVLHSINVIPINRSSFRQKRRVNKSWTETVMSQHMALIVVQKVVRIFFLSSRNRRYDSVDCLRTHTNESKSYHSVFLNCGLVHAFSRLYWKSHNCHLWWFKNEAFTFIENFHLRSVKEGMVRLHI